MKNIEKQERWRNKIMLLENKKLVLMGVRNKWSIAWGAAKSAHDNGAQLICTYNPEEGSEKLAKLLEEL